MTAPVKPVISDVDFIRLQKMAKLTLDHDESQLVHDQLDEALRAIEVFDELALSEVPPLSHPGHLTNVLRDDKVEPSLTQSQALQNAPAVHAGYVMVPGVLEEQS